MKKVVAFFCVIAVCCSLFVPVFAGASSPNTPSEDTQAVDPEPVRSVGSLTYSVGTYTFGDYVFSYNYICNFTLNNNPYDNTIPFRTYYIPSDCYGILISAPSSYTSSASGVSGTFLFDAGFCDCVVYTSFSGSYLMSAPIGPNQSSYSGSRSFYSSNFAVTLPKSSGSSIKLGITVTPLPPETVIVTETVVVTEIVYTNDPQYSLDDVYNFFIDSGVNSDWASAGVIILFLLLGLSIIVFIFKICFGRKK